MGRQLVEITQVAQGAVTRKLAAILAVDMVGFSRLIGADEAGTIARQKAHRAEIFEPCIAEHNGRIVKSTGDGLLVEFASAVDATLCAVAVQRAVAAHEADQPAEQRIAYRVGVNLGEIVVDGDDILGDGVNVAARLEALAEPGGINLSEAVFRNVRGKLDLGFADLGAQQVKNIADPVRIFRVLLSPADAGKMVVAQRPRPSRRRWYAAVVTLLLAVAAGAAILWHPWAPTISQKSTIAVLNFANLSGDATQDHLGRGIAGDLFTDISRNPGLLVAAWEASARIDPTKADLKDVGRRLNVAYVLTGDIRRVGDLLRVSVRLVDTATLYNLWAARYDRRASELFALQDDVTGKVVAALKLKPAPADQTAGKRRTANPAAYDMVLQARANRAKISPQSTERAIAFYRRAIELDPGYVQAYVELAYAHIFYWFITGSSDRLHLDRAHDLGRKALALDPASANAHSFLGWYHIWNGEHAAAIRSLERALALDPNNGDTLARLSLAHMFAGRPAEGLKYIWLARNRTAYEPQNYGIYAGLCYLYLNRLEEAVRELKRSASLNPRNFVAYRLLAIVYAELGQMQEARKAAAEALRINPRLSIGLLRRQLPFKNPADLERQLNALRKAGFPD